MDGTTSVELWLLVEGEMLPLCLPQPLSWCLMGCDVMET